MCIFSVRMKGLEGRRGFCVINSCIISAFHRVIRYSTATGDFDALRMKTSPNPGVGNDLDKPADNLTLIRTCPFVETKRRQSCSHTGRSSPRSYFDLRRPLILTNLPSRGNYSVAFGSRGFQTGRKCYSSLTEEPLIEYESNGERGSFRRVIPGKVRNIVREIPVHIEKPDYWKTGHPRVTLIPRPIEIKGPEVIDKMRKSCGLAKKVLNAACQKAKPGVTTEEIDDFVFNFTIASGAYPSPLNYKGFPKSVCTSVNNVACHGVPDNRPLVDGDIVNIDVMVYIDGYHGDCSETVLVGNVDASGKRLVKAAKDCLDEAILACGPGVPFQVIGKTIEDLADERGFSVVPAFTGHGIGREVHCVPDIYHFDYPYPGKMRPGMTFTIEPVLTHGYEDIAVLEDGWTAVTEDDSRTAQFEHTILITEQGVEILTV